MVANQITKTKRILIGPHGSEALLVVPTFANALVIFGHGGSSSRLNQHSDVARQLEHSGIAALFLDLLTPEEEANHDNLFDIDLLSSRLEEATRWACKMPELRGLPIGYFGASAGGGAALAAAAMNPGDVRAIVSLGGRPDLASEWFSAVEAPTLLLVGSHDPQIVELNHIAMARMKCTVELCLFPGLGQAFDGLGTLNYVVRQVTQWFKRYLNPDELAPIHLPFSQRTTAGRLVGHRSSLVI